MDHAIDAETTISRAERVVHAELREETVLLDTSKGVALRLNATGAWLWEQLEKPSPLGGLATALAERFEVPEARAFADARAFVETMLDRGLIESHRAG